MRIDQLKLQNFNGFASCEIKFDPHFNLLVGDNASGKSTVLDALAILLDSWILGVKGDEKGGGIIQEQVRLASYKYDDSVTFEKQFPARLESALVLLGRSMNWARELNREHGRTTYVEAKGISGIARYTAHQVRDGNPITLPLTCSYGTERLWYETRHRRSPRNKEVKIAHASRLDSYADCNVFEIQETTLLSWIRAQYLDGLQSGKGTTAFRAMERAVIECIEGATGLFYSERYKDAVIELRSTGPQFFKNLSDGQRIMLTLVGDLVRRSAGLNPHLGDKLLEMTPGVVLIDELDLHLHPIWQRRVIHDLKRTFPSVQFIATTHSPQLIGEAKPHEILVLADGKASNPSHSFGLDSSRVLGEVQLADPRNPEVNLLIQKISLAIDELKFEDANRMLRDLEEQVGPDDVEITRARSLIKFMESPL